MKMISNIDEEKRFFLEAELHRTPHERYAITYQLADNRAFIGGLMEYYC
jgi:hypothetical protein